MPPKKAPLVLINNPTSHQEIFRSSSIGIAFADSLDERVRDGRLTGEQAYRLMCRFDTAITNSLAKVRTNFKFKGKCMNYRNCDDVWVFNLADVTFYFKAEGEVVFAKRVKLVANEHISRGDEESREMGRGRGRGRGVGRGRGRGGGEG